jgi:AcrR family transcriptional regulator
MKRTSAKHRRPSESGYARGDETRARIVLAALKLFGELGFEGASTRDIATAAGVNAPALQYYFDSKEGLYLACAEHIIDHVWAQMGDVIAQAGKALAANASDEELIAAFCAIQTRLAEFMFSSLEAADWRLFMARQQSGGGPAAGFQLIFQRMHKPMRAVMASIVGRLIGLPPTDNEVQIRTMALNGQLTVFQVIKRTALASLNWERIDAGRLELLQRIIREHTTSLLRSMIETREQTRGGARLRPRSVSSSRGSDRPRARRAHAR